MGFVGGLRWYIFFCAHDQKPQHKRKFPEKGGEGNIIPRTAMFFASRKVGNTFTKLSKFSKRGL